MPLFSKPADFRRAGITLLLTACMCYPVALRATEIDLSVRAVAEGTAPIPTDSEPIAAAPTSTEPASSQSASAKSAGTESVDTESVGDASTQPGQPEQPSQPEGASEVSEVEVSEIENSTELEMPTVEAAAAQGGEEGSELTAPAKDKATRELSVAPGQDPLQPEKAPSWVGATPDLDGDTHTLVVSSMPAVKKARVDAELDMPLCKTVIDYVKHDLADDHQDVDLSPYITADYIRKNLIDSPDGYVAEIATSKGPMYQKWVKVNITPEQQRQLNAWYVEAVQARRLPPIGFGLVGLLSVIGLSHLVLRRKHAHASAPVEVSSDIEPVVKHRSGVLGTLAVLGMLGLGVIGLGAFFTVTRVQSTQAEMNRVQAEKVRDAAMAEVARVRAEVEGSFGRSPLDQAEIANPSDLFGTPTNTPSHSSAPQPPTPPNAVPGAGELGTQLPNAGVTTTINRNGNQQIIIRTRSR